MNSFSLLRSQCELAPRFTVSYSSRHRHLILIQQTTRRWALALATVALLAGAAATRAQDESQAKSQDEGQDDSTTRRPRSAAVAPAAAAATTGLAVPTGYFLFPVAPGQPGFLAATMGELRPNHFHGGLDIKTASVVNRPVYAAAEGWVSRLKQSSYGYGNVLYVSHSNGMTTVYGHLNEFKGPVAAELLRQQYEKQSYELELFFDRDKFPVRRGEVVALSGNTGGSAGPHLHWEVRDAQERQLNPLQWGGFAEIQDHLGPVVQALAVEPLGIGARVRGRFERALVLPRAQPAPGASTVLPDTVACTGQVGLLLQGFDRLDNAWNRNGIQRVSMRVNGQAVYQHRIDAVPFPSGSRQVNNFVDYFYQQTAGRSLQKLWVDEGNDLPIYTPAGVGQGRLSVEPGKLYTIDIEMADSYENKAHVRLTLRGVAAVDYQELSAKSLALEAKSLKPGASKQQATSNKQPATPTRLRYEITRNLLRAIATSALRDSATGRPENLTLRRGNRQLQLRPSYSAGAETTYLYDLRAGLPDSLRLGETVLAFDRQVAIVAGQETSYATPHLNLLFAPKTLFSTLYLRTDYQPATATAPETWRIGPVLSPLYLPLRLSLKPAAPVPADERAHTAIYALSARGSRAYVGGTWATDGTAISVPIKQLGTFRLYADTKPPEARLLSRAGGQLVFRVGDDLSGLRAYRLLVGGRFRLLRFEHKNNTLRTMAADSLGPPLHGPAELHLTDEAGNERVLPLAL